VWYQIGAAKHWLDRLASLVPVRLVLAVSHYVAKAQDRIWPRRASTVVWPGIDIAECAGFAAVDRARLRSELRLPVDAPLAVIAGRLQYWKGMHTPIAAMPKVLAHFPKAHLCLVGAAHEAEPNYPQMLAKLASNLGVADHVTFAGRQDGVPRWMAAADVVVHASQEEPFGIVAIEAMACGRPVITGSDGGVCEAVRDGMEGIHVPFGDEAKLADALIRLFANPELASRLGTCGLQRAMQFTRERYAEEICSALEAAAR
jgi:glycosyltransferase involved in cell wall biosynthesis